MNQYCLGFLFSPGATNVALIRKSSPDWQAGKLNAIGGRLQPNETPHQAMVREFHEEASLVVPQWNDMGLLQGKDWCVHLFWQELIEHKVLIGSAEEPVAWHPKSHTKDRIANLRWLIPMAFMLSQDNCEVASYIVTENPNE